MPQSGITAANSNTPLWQRVTVRVALNHAALDALNAAERSALWEKSVATMKPDAAEQAAMEGDTNAQNAYMLTFVKAYKAGMPPLAQFVENTRHQTS